MHPELRTRATEVFGWKLRPDQESVIDAVLEGRDALAVMPTGSGKSAIYQVAGLGLDGLVVVVSPARRCRRTRWSGSSTIRVRPAPSP
ncbi:DEAD/DEAH box helicase [Curtobacterium flaccumfaciens]|nr:DEAD/DEAH box helicase [Curtobacterium flaccumfaciens]